MNKFYRVEVQEADEGFLFIELPLELLDELGWDVGDELAWEETEICDTDSEDKGLVLHRLADDHPVDG